MSQIIKVYNSTDNKYEELNSDIATETTLSSMRDNVTTKVYDGPAYADVETTSTAIDCKSYTMCALYMIPDNVTGTCHLQYSPNDSEYQAEWVDIHEEVFNGESNNRVTIRDLCASMVRFQIDNNADNSGGIKAFITLSRT